MQKFFTYFCLENPRSHIVVFAGSTSMYSHNIIIVELQFSSTRTMLWAILSIRVLSSKFAQILIILIRINILCHCSSQTSQVICQAIAQ